MNVIRRKNEKIDHDRTNIFVFNSFFFLLLFDWSWPHITVHLSKIFLTNYIFIFLFLFLFLFRFLIYFISLKFMVLSYWIQNKFSTRIKHLYESLWWQFGFFLWRIMNVSGRYYFLPFSFLQFLEKILMF